MASPKKNITQKQIPPKKNAPQAQLAIHNSSFNITSHKYFIPAVLFLLCMLLYGNTLLNGYTLDDEIVTFKNDFVVKGFSAFKDIFDKGSLYGWNKTTSAQQYRPLTLLNFMTEVSLFGLNPHVSHFFNVLFFALTVVLLYFFLQKILKNYNPAIIIAATLLYAFHPIHTEVVANIKSRDEILGLLFGLTSFYFIMLYEEKKEVYLYYFISLAAFSIAIFCKESCLTYVAIIPLLLYFFTGLEIKKIALTSLPYIGLVVFYLFIRHLVLPSMTFTNPIDVMDNALMATDSNSDRIATSFVLLGKYIYMTIVPYPLSYDYSYNQIPIVSWGNVMPILSVLICAGMLGFMVWGIRKKSIYSFLIALFFITFFLSSNIVIRIAATFAERFLYAPSLSFCIVLPILIAKAMKLNPAQLVWKNKTYFYAPMACLLIIYAIIVIPRNAVWKNNYTLFSSGVITAPNSARVRRFMAFAYRDSAIHSKDSARKLKFYSLAIQETKKAIEIKNASPEWCYDLGVYYDDAGYRDSAIIAYKKALALSPNYALASDNLAIIYLNKKQFDSALSYFFKTYNMDTNNLEALRNIGLTYQSERNYNLALQYYNLILKKDPGNKPTLTNLSCMHNDWGVQYLNNHALDNAIMEFQAAVVCDSTSANAIGNIGLVYYNMGNIEMAKIYFQKALAKDPKNAVFARNLEALNLIRPKPLKGL